MMHMCIRDIARQLHAGSVWRTTAAFNDYLREHPEAEEGLRQVLTQARDLEFTGWGEIPLD